MASLDNPHQASSVAVNVPGRPDQIVLVWRLKMKSASDTITVPQLALRSGSDDASTCRVIQPATGVVSVPAATTSDNENVVTLTGASNGDEVVFVSVHPRGNQGTRASDPA